MTKNPWVAAILNFFLFGAGTLYVGRRPALTAVMLLLGGTVVQVVEIIMSPAVHYVPSIWPFFFAGLVTVKLALAVDGYREAKEAR